MLRLGKDLIFEWEEGNRNIGYRILKGSGRNIE